MEGPEGPEGPTVAYKDQGNEGFLVTCPGWEDSPRGNRGKSVEVRGGLGPRRPDHNIGRCSYLRSM